MPGGQVIDTYRTRCREQADARVTVGRRGRNGSVERGTAREILLLVLDDTIFGGAPLIIWSLVLES